MKKILTVIALVVCFAGSLHCQLVNNTITKYLKNFEGVWEYKSSNELFRVVLKKGYSSSFKSEIIVGGYRYEKEGVVIYDDTENIPDVFEGAVGVEENSAPIVAVAFESTTRPVNPNHMFLFFYDKLLGKHSLSMLELASPTQLHWWLRENEGVYILKEGETLPPEGFSVPEDVMLTKVK